MSKSTPRTAIFVMPATSKAWIGAEGLWVTTAGWAAAAARKLGNSVVVTQDRIATAEEVLDYPLRSEKEKERKSSPFWMAPAFSRIIIRDFLNWKDSRNWKIFRKLRYEKGEVAFVWEKHDLFSGKGLSLAKRLKVPYIGYVHAPVVWEAERWGVRRYWWGRILERREAAVLKKADVVAVVSKEVKAQLENMGIPSKKLLVSPMAVDPSLYNVLESETKKLRRQLGLEGKFVIGWTGSFRGFHGLEQIIRGFKEVVVKYPESVLLLVGDGKERILYERLIPSLGLSENVIFTGRIPYRKLPLYLSVFDVGVAGAKTSVDFHYSPQKIRDYMAAGKPVLAPNVGEIPLIFEDHCHLKLFEVGKEKSVQDGLEFYLENKEKAAEIAQAGHQLVMKSGTWEHELNKCLKFISKNI